MKPAEVILVVDRKPLQEISLRSKRKIGNFTCSCCSKNRKASKVQNHSRDNYV